MQHSFIRQVLIALALLTGSTGAWANDSGWADASDVVRAGLIIAAVGAPVVQGDEQGALQAGGSISAALLTTEVLKQSFPSLRPDGSDNRSFPSGHTSTAFAAAATIYERQGRTAGIAAHVAAAFVAVARVEARKHRWGDVIVGAAVGEAAGLLITNRRTRNVAMMPWADTRGGGVMIAARF